VRRAGILLLTALVAGCADAANRDITIRAHDMTLDLRGDGTLRVRQRAVVEFAPQSAGRFALPTPDGQVDGVTGVVATMDGATFREGEGPGTYSWGDRIVWHFPAPGPGTHEFTLEYLAHGVMALRGARGSFVWPAAATGGLSVERATVRLTLPDGAVPVEPPSVTGDAWTVRLDGPVTYMEGRAAGGPELPLIRTELVLDDLTVREPRWQFNQQLGAELTPAFIAAGLFLVVVGAGIIWMVRVQYRAVPPDADGAMPGVGPATAALLASRPSMRGVGRQQCADLVSAGLVDGDRLLAAGGLRIAAVVVVLLALGLGVVVPPIMARFGPWPLAIPAGLLVVAAMFWVSGVRLRTLTGAGERVAALSTRRAGSGATSSAR